MFVYIETATNSHCHNHSMRNPIGNGPQAARPNSEFLRTIVVERERAQPSPGGDRSGDCSVQPRMVRHPIVSALLFALVALAIFLNGLGNPTTMFYDESFYVVAARSYLIHGPNTNPEAPPLGKLLVAMAVKAAGDNSFGWRVASSVCGALTLMAIFLWTHLLARDFQIACIAAALTFFNNFLFVMSRVAMMDAFLVFFLLWGLVAYTAAVDLDLGAISRRILICCAGSLLGLATACKWNGVDTLAVLLVVSLALYWMGTRAIADANASIARYSRNLRQIGMPSLILSLTVAPVAFYSLTFWPLCRSLHLPFGIHQLVAMNLYVWRFHVAVVVNGAITSVWYTWPLNSSPQRALSYLLGNPVVMWSGLAALLYCLRNFWKSLAVAEGLLVLLYGANLLQWAVTPALGTFYYYYYPAAMILGVAIALALHSLSRSVFGVRLSLVVLVVAAGVFLWCYPRMAHLESPWDCVLGCWN
jgi:dolichyl-phosphate-mannose-protein mannosyltransferase